MNTTSYRRPGLSPKPYCHSSRSPWSSRRRPLVLVVDDCECVRAAIKLVLREMAGCRVVTAATSEEALGLARRRRFDVVTSDLSRCGMNGLEFLKVFKQAHPTVPVIIVSAVLNDATACRAKWLGAFDCLPKPFQLRELVDLVQAAITSRKVCRTMLWP
jgi:DNA-binding NtrC family response regulator